MKLKTCLCCYLLLLPASALLAQTYNIRDFGAKTDSTFLNTKAIQKAIDAYTSKGGAK
jgi:polygalacturonase